MRSLTIGRHPSCDIHIDLPRISRLHARLLIRHDECVIEDLQSANGTTVNGVGVRRSSLSPGDVLEVAGARVPWQEAVSGNQRRRHSGDTAAPALVCCNVTLFDRSGSREACRLHEVSFAAKSGQLMAIIGPSGAGKTTLLRVLTGALAPSEGMVLVHGDNLHLNPARIRPRLGYVPQDDIIHHELRLREALYHSAQLRVVPPESAEETDKRVYEVAETCGLCHRLDSRIRDLSGGERKRASIAVELLTSPGTIYLDEPTSGLDPALERTFMELARRLADDGRVIVITTHTTRSIELCDLVLIMGSGGQVAYFGPPRYICQHFGVDDVADVYGRLTDRPDAAARIVAEFKTSRVYRRYVLQPLAAAASESPDETSRPVLVPARRQAAVLLRRQLSLFLGDGVNTGILLAQAPVIAVIVSLMFPHNSFTASAHVRHSPSVIFMLAIAGIWFGVSNAAREVVKERAVHRRERGAGLAPGAYLISKLIPLAILSALQTLILFVIIGLSMGWFDLESAADLLTLWALLWLAALSGVTMGLVLSTLARSTDQAISLTPVVLLPQIMFSGVFSVIQDSGSIVKILGHCTISKWCFGGAGNVAGLPAKLEGIGISNEAFEHLPPESAIALLALSGIMAAAAYAFLYVGEWE